MKIYKPLYFVIILLFACTEKQINFTVINEVFQTARDEAANIDSPAIWHGPNGEHWIIATAKEANALYVADALNGETIKKIGSEGAESGQFKRPNGIAVFDDYIFVVERDNRRVQVLTLPEFKSIGIIRDSMLTNPYGLFIYRDSTQINHLFITDNYETADEQVPALNELNRRVHHYTFKISKDLLESQLLKVFGDTTKEGALSVVESIYGDPEHNQLLLAEEDTTQNTVKVYDLNGNYSGKNFGQEIFKGQIEGFALYKTNKTKGYWIITDQSHKNNHFHIFSRGNFQHLGYFSGLQTTNTDGVWLSQVSFGPFSNGAFYAVHDDGNVSAFDFKQIAAALNLSLDN